MKEYCKTHLSLRRIIFLFSVAILTIIFSLLFIKFLGNFLGLLKLEQPALIIKQIRYQKLFLAFYVPLIFIFINFVIIDLVKNYRILQTILLIFSIILSFLLVIFLSKINGILLGKVLWKAISILLGGGISL